MKNRNKVALLGVALVLWLVGCSEDEVFYPTRLGVGDGFLVDRTDKSYYPRYSVILPVPEGSAGPYSESYSLADVPDASYDLRVALLPKPLTPGPVLIGELVEELRLAETEIAIKVIPSIRKSAKPVFEYSGPIADWRTAGSGDRDWHFYRLTGLPLGGEFRVEVSIKAAAGESASTSSLQVELAGGGKRK